MYKGLMNCVMLNIKTIDKLLPNLAFLIAINGNFK